MKPSSDNHKYRIDLTKTPPSVRWGWGSPPQTSKSQWSVTVTPIEPNASPKTPAPTRDNANTTNNNSSNNTNSASPANGANNANGNNNRNNGTNSTNNTNGNNNANRKTENRIWNVWIFILASCVCLPGWLAGAGDLGCHRRSSRKEIANQPSGRHLHLSKNLITTEGYHHTNKKVRVECDSTWEMTNLPEWISYLEHDGLITFYFSPNYDPMPRDVKIRFKSGELENTLKILQYGTPSNLVGILNRPIDKSDEKERDEDYDPYYDPDAPEYEDMRNNDGSYPEKDGKYPAKYGHHPDKYGPPRR